MREYGINGFMCTEDRARGLGKIQWIVEWGVYVEIIKTIPGSGGVPELRTVP